MEVSENSVEEIDSMIKQFQRNLITEEREDSKQPEERIQREQGSPMMEAENQREVLSQMKKKAEQLTLSASPQKKAILGRRSRQFFIRVLKRKMGKFSDGFVFTLHKEFFLQEVTDIARYLGYQETQLSIVPALTSLTKSSDALAHQMLQRLPDLSQAIIEELAGNEVKGLAFITTQLFPLITLAFNNAPNNSTEHITTCLHKLIKLSSHDILRERIYSLLVQSIFKPSLSALNDEHKAGAVQLMADNLDILSTAQIQKYIGSELKVLSSRCIPFKLQKNLAKLLGSICAHPCIASSHFESLVFPVYYKLLKQQDLWGLRKAAVQGIDKVVYCAILAERGDWIQQLLEQMNSLLQDGSKWVRYQATKVIAKFLHIIVSAKKQILNIRTSYISPSYLKKKEVSSDDGINLWNRIEKKILSCLVSTVRLTSYSLEEVKFEIAYNFPAFVLVSSKQFCNSSQAASFWSKHFQSLHKMLAHDLDWNVKKTIAASLHQVAGLIISKLDIQDAKPKVAYFLSIVARFLDSELDQVQVNCLHVLPSLFKIFPSELLDGKPKDIFQLIYERNDSRAVTQKKSAILAQFCDIFLPDIVCGIFESCYDKLTTHENALVRKNAACAFGSFYLRMQRCHDVQFANSPGSFSSSFLKKRYASIAAQAAMENYCAPKQYSTNFQQRIVFLQMLGSIMHSYLKKSLPSDAVNYIEYLLSLQNDSVICVRLAIVTILKELRQKFTQLTIFGDEAENALELFKSDDSREIRIKSKIEPSPVADKLLVSVTIDPTNFRFIETELEQEGDAENSNNLSLIQLSQTPTSFTDVLKRAVGGGSSNSFLTQLMNAFEEKDREAKQSQQEDYSNEKEDRYDSQEDDQIEDKSERKSELKEQTKEQKHNVEKREEEKSRGKRQSKEVSKSPNQTPKHRTAPPAGARKSNPKLLSLRPASAYKKHNGLSLMKSSRATSASSENTQRLREAGSTTGLPPLQPKQSQKSVKAPTKSEITKRVRQLDKTSTKQSLPNLAEESGLKKGITPPGSRRQGRSSLSSQRPGSFNKSRGQRNLSALSSLTTQRKGMNLVKQRFLEIATLSNDENESSGLNRIQPSSATIPMQILQTSAPKRLFGAERLNVNSSDTSGILNRLELGQSLKKVRKLKRIQNKNPQQIFGEVPSTLNRSLAGALRSKNSGFNRTSLPGTSFRSHSSSINTKSTFPSLSMGLDL